MKTTTTERKFLASHIVSDGNGRATEIIFTFEDRDFHLAAKSLADHLVDYFYDVNDNLIMEADCPVHVAMGIGVLFSYAARSNGYQGAPSTFAPFRHLWHETPNGPGVTTWSLYSVD